MYHSKGVIAFLLLFSVTFNHVVTQQSPKPNIVIIVSDDMGFNDIGFHGSNQIPTPNIDALAAYGINLNRYYVSPMCTPSRSSLMTGKYSSNVGMQHYVISNSEPYGLGLNEKLMPEYLKEAGYDTHMVGKWHLGYYKKVYTPTFRGFDSHVGVLAALVDYYNHSFSIPNRNWSGHDMRKNLDPYRETIGMYATDLFTDESIKIVQNHNQRNPLFLYISHVAPHAANAYDPLQAPQEVIDRFSYIKDVKRRKYAAMVSILDDSVGKVVNALKEKQMLDNTVILFFCDNGSPIDMQYSNGGSNNPFRGQKESPWEGAVRSAAVIWSSKLQNRERTSNQLFHISDWLPTFAGLAGVSIDKPIDGRDIWPALSYNSNSPRNDVVLHLDDVSGFQSYIAGDFKYLNGTTYNGSYDRWMDNVDKSESHSMFHSYGASIMNSFVGRALAPYSLSNLTALAIEMHRQSSVVTCNDVPLPTEKQFQCFPLEGPCLFNITEDPCERRNIAVWRPVTLDVMASEVNKFRLKSQPVRNKPFDERANPGSFNNTWTWWFDELGLPDNVRNAATCYERTMNVFLLTALSIVISIRNIWRTISDE